MASRELIRQALSLSGSALVGCSRETAAARAWERWAGASAPRLFSPLHRGLPQPWAAEGGRAGWVCGADS